jgi:alpha-galactosidase
MESERLFETGEQTMEQILATCGAANVTEDSEGRQWTIGNAAIRKTLAWRDGAGLCLAALEQRATGYAWRPDLQANKLAGGEFSFSWNGATLSARQATALHGSHAVADAASVTLRIDLRVADALDVSLCYRLRADTAVIEQWLEVTPLQAGTLRRVAPLTVSVDALPSPVLHWARGLQGHGAGMPATGPYPAFQMRHEPLGEVALESGLRSTWHEIAWFALDNDTSGNTGGDGLFVGLLYSGRWSAHAQAVATGGASLELFSDGYAMPLPAGETWNSPASFVGVYRGDLDDAAHVQHAYMRAAVMPPTPDDFPWVQYNTWFAHLVDIDESILRDEAARAARLGAEVFVIDAGWWEPSRRTSDNFTTGLGVWQPSTEKFPSGISAFGDYVRSLGMRFGIWVEPERVDLRQPAAWRLNWLVRHHDAIVSPPWPPDTVSGWLCFGHPAVQAWAIDWISRLVSDVNADWLKWDSNWWGVCTCTNHGHSATDGEWHQVQGVHTVLAELRRRFPNLIIENCAGGGTRTDFAMLANTHITWLHDASTPSRRVRFHLAGANYLFPPELCNTWIVDADDESLMDPAASRADLDAIARSRMYGAFGVSARLAEWTDAAFAAVQAAIVQYKQLRPLLKRGRFYHLLPQAELFCTDLALHGQWEAYAILDNAAGEGAIWVFRSADGEETHRLQLRGLDAHQRYALSDIDTAQVSAATGKQLMEDGFTAELAERTSALMTLRAV